MAQGRGRARRGRPCGPDVGRCRRGRGLCSGREARRRLVPHLHADGDRHVVHRVRPGERRRASVPGAGARRRPLVVLRRRLPRRGDPAGHDAPRRRGSGRGRVRLAVLGPRARRRALRRRLARGRRGTVDHLDLRMPGRVVPGRRPVERRRLRVRGAGVGRRPLVRLLRGRPRVGGPG